MSVRKINAKVDFSGMEYSLRTVLEQMDKSELVDLLFELSSSYENVNNHLKIKFSQGEEEVALCSQVMRGYIKEASREGRIKSENVARAASGGEQVLLNATQRLATGDHLQSTALCVAILSLYVPLLEQCDDSEGTIGFLVDRCISCISSATTQAVKAKAGSSEKSKLFSIISTQAMEDWYDGWIDWRADLFYACICLCGESSIHQALTETIDRIIEEAPDNRWHKLYVAKKLKEISYLVIKTFDGDAAADKFIVDHLEYDNFREIAIKNAMNKKRFNQVVELCTQQGDFPSNRWKEYLYRAYQELGDIHNQRKVAEDLVLSGNGKYYSKLKNLYLPEEWSDQRELLLMVFEESDNPPPIYMEILSKEKLDGRLVAYFKTHLANILEGYTYFNGRSSDKVEELFCDYIRTLARNSTDIDTWKQVDAALSAFRTACGLKPAQKMADALYAIYPEWTTYINSNR